MIFFPLFFVLSGACQDLPALYLKGGSIIPVGLPHEHVEEANPSDDLTLFVALDDHGKSMHSIFPWHAFTAILIMSVLFRLTCCS